MHELGNVPVECWQKLYVKIKNPLRAYNKQEIQTYANSKR